jgi:hypothetical protein
MARTVLLRAFCSVNVLFSGIALGAQATSAATRLAYKNPHLPVDRRVEDLLAA